MYSSRQGVALLEQILVAVAGSEGLGRLAVMVPIVEAVSAENVSPTTMLTNHHAQIV